MEDDGLTQLANSPKKTLPSFSRRKNGFSRSDVVESVQRAFEMIGGVPRLALWANANPTEFYRLYGKLLPATSLHIGDNATVKIIHAIAPTALDVHDHPALIVEMDGTVIPALARIESPATPESNG